MAIRSSDLESPILLLHPTNPFHCKCMGEGGEKERDRETDREIDTETETDRQAGRDRDRESNRTAPQTPCQSISPTFNACYSDG